MKMSQNYPMAAVALTAPMHYRQTHDPFLSPIQTADICGFSDHFGDELAPSRGFGGRAEYGQNRASRRICGFGGFNPLRLAKTLGRNDIFRAGILRYRNRIGSTFYVAGPNRLSGRYSRQYDGGGARPHYFSYILDKTPTINRRFSCVL